MLLLNILYITVMCVIVLDVSGFYGEITTIISKWLSNGHIARPIYVKPFCCSLCMSHWINLIYVIIIGRLSIGIWCYILVCSIFTPVIASLIVNVRDLLIRITNKIG